MKATSGRLPRSRVLSRPGRSRSFWTGLVCFFLVGWATSPASGMAEGGEAYVPPEWVQQPLSREEIGLQHFISRITWESAEDPDPWGYWYVNPVQTGLDGLRYPLAFAGYASFLLGARTPAYTDLAGRQLRNIIERMLEWQVWSYVEVYWADEPFFPDPIYPGNVMYSGHLLQLMGMYQLLTGDDRYATEGVDFIWKDGTIIHYTLHDIALRMHELMCAHRSGGITCEPDLIFVYCNNHSSVGLLIYDTLYPTPSVYQALEKWRKWVQRRSVYLVDGPGYFKIVYSVQAHAFIPYGEAGGDAWGLGWMIPWNPDDAFILRGWQDLLSNPLFVETQDGAIHLEVSPLLETMDITVPMATGFLPLLAREMEGPSSPVAAGVLAWFSRYATWWDGDGDGYEEVLSFETGDDRNVATANVAAGLALVDRNMLRDVLRDPQGTLGEGPRVTDVAYPDVEVTQAFRLPDGGVQVRIVPGRPTAPSSTSFRIDAISTPVRVTRDGEPYDGFLEQGTAVTVTTDLQEAHTFQVVPIQP